MTSTVRIAHRRVPLWLVLATIAVLLLGVVRVASAPGGPAGPARPAAPSGEQPNIVVIMTDDQTLASMAGMANVQELLVQRGTSFTDSIITFPVCCPARATFLTGQYAHNHGVRSNLPPNGGNDKLDHTNTLPVWLDDAGYATSHVGKYLNTYGQYTPAVQPPGWDRWYTTIDPSTYRYWDYEVLANGEHLTFGDSDEDYQTDVMGEQVLREIDQLSAGSDPFFLVWSTLAPHNATGREQTLSIKTIPAPRHAGTLADQPLPKGPSYQEPDVSDKPSTIRDNGPIDEVFADEFYHAYVESLLAVDEWVAKIVAELDRTGVLEETIIIFTSDNGVMVGEHGVSAGYKLLPYEESLLVPMVVRGPGFPAGATSDRPVANVDLAATIVRAAGATPERVLDGYDLQTVLTDPSVLNGRAALIDNGTGGGDLVPAWIGVRTDRYTYVEYRATGEVELYDRQVDPFELESRHADPAMAEVRAALAAVLVQLEGCAGDSCRTPRFVEP